MLKVHVRRSPSCCTLHIRVRANGIPTRNRSGRDFHLDTVSLITFKKFVPLLGGNVYQSSIQPYRLSFRTGNHDINRLYPIVRHPEVKRGNGRGNGNPDIIGEYRWQCIHPGRGCHLLLTSCKQEEQPYHAKTVFYLFHLI